jgi:hypothetical protein
MLPNNYRNILPSSHGLKVSERKTRVDPFIRNPLRPNNLIELFHGLIEL